MSDHGYIASSDCALDPSSSPVANTLSTDHLRLETAGAEVLTQSPAGDLVAVLPVMMGLLAIE